MSKQTIWNALRRGGLTEAGTAGLMGNMYCESLLQSNIVETRCKLSAEEYTVRVDSGVISRETFIRDAFGYGLCQWTYPSRKEALFDFAKARGASIGDEAMQVAFCLQEFPNEAPDTWNLICSSNDIYKCAEWICKYYERPAVNNISQRYGKAQEYFNEFSGSSIDTDNDGIGPVNDVIGDRERRYETLRKGSGMDGALHTVRAWQDMLCAWGFSTDVDGKFGNDTEEKTKAWQSYVGLEPTGEVGLVCWDEVLHIPV